MHKRLSIVIVIAVALAVLSVGPAVAAKVTVLINGGPLDLTPSSDQSLADVTLDGNDTSSTGTLGQVQVRDARGTGTGWYVTLSGTDFFNESSTALTIDSNGFSVPSTPTVTTVAGNGGVAASSGILAGAGFSLLDSPSPNGRGIYRTTPDLYLAVPAETYVGTYASTVTETLLSY